MNTKQIVTKIVQDHPEWSNAQVAEEASRQGAKPTERQLRKVAAKVKGDLHVENDHTPKQGDVLTESFDGGVKSFEYTGSKKIESVEEAMAFFKVDTKKWEVSGWSASVWGAEAERTSVKLTLKPVAVDGPDLEALLDGYRKAVKKIKPRPRKGKGKGVAVLADIHAGARVKGEMRTEDFNPEILVQRLNDVASETNAGKFEEVEVVILGDFIESFSGLNHVNTFKSLEYGAYGANAVVMAYEMITDFLKQVNNLSGITMVAGNHDRTSIKADLDSNGDAATIIAKMLELSGQKVDYHPYVVAKDIDGIQYIFTHGHLGLSKKDISHVAWNHGAQGKYNFLIMGHYHSRSGSKPIVQKETHLEDSIDFRAMFAPSLFTGNAYSAQNGWSSSAGFLLIWNAGHGRPNVLDVAIK
jgi:predicted phosphodiesterase